MTMFLASDMMLILCLLSMRLFLKVTNVSKSIIVPAVLTCCMVGAFTRNNCGTDIYLLLGIGILGYVPTKFDYPLAPLMLSVILGPIAKTNLRRALMTNEDWTLIFTRPVSLMLLVLAGR